MKRNVFDFQGNLMDYNTPGGMRKEAYRRAGRAIPMTFRMATEEETAIAELEASLAGVRLEKAQDFARSVDGLTERVCDLTEELRGCHEGITHLCSDLELYWERSPQTFAFGGWDEEEQETSMAIVPTVHAAAARSAR